MTREDILHMAQEAGWETPLTWDEAEAGHKQLLGELANGQ